MKHVLANQVFQHPSLSRKKDIGDLIYKLVIGYDLYSTAKVILAKKFVQFSREVGKPLINALLLQKHLPIIIVVVNVFDKMQEIDNNDIKAILSSLVEMKLTMMLTDFFRIIPKK